MEEMIEAMRPQFERGYAPCDEPPGFEERAYKEWLKRGGKVKYLTAAAAHQLAAKPHPDHEVRENIVVAVLNCYLQAIEKKAKLGGRWMLFSEADKIRTPVRPNEVKTVHDRLRELGYTLNDDSIHW